MRLAEKRDDIADEDESGGKAPAVGDDKSKAPPAASLTSAVFQRRQETSRGVQVESLDLQAIPEAPEAPVGARAQQAILEQAFSEPEFTELELAAPELAEPELAAPELAESELAESELAEPALAAPEFVEPELVEPEPVAVTPPIARTEFQSARDSAAHWSLRRSPFAGFWDRFFKDVSIFTIFFAVLVFVILQTM